MPRDVMDALGSKPVDRLMFPSEHPFFTRQKRIVREFAGTFDPEDIEDSIRVGAYQGLLKALTEMTPTEVIAGNLDERACAAAAGRGFRRG